MAVPADPGASFKKAEAEGGGEFAVVVLDAPAACGPATNAAYLWVGRTDSSRSGPEETRRPACSPAAAATDSARCCQLVEHLRGHQPRRAVSLRVGDLRRRPRPGDLLDLLDGRRLHTGVFLRHGRIAGGRLAAQAASVRVRGLAIWPGYAALVPGLRHEQPPVQHRRRDVGRRVDTDGDLAVGDLPRGCRSTAGPSAKPPTALAPEPDPAHLRTAAKHRHDARTTDTPQRPNEHY